MVSERFKIFPLLIVVAMLAFSVRLVELVSGVSDFVSGSALAQEAADSKPDPSALAAPGQKDAPPVDKMTDKTTEPQIPEGAQAKEPPAAEKSGEDKPADAGAGAAKVKDVKKQAQGVIWKDAGDSDIDAAQGVKMEMYQDLSKRRDSLDAREKDVQSREALLKAAEQELDRKYQELETIRTEIKGLLVQQSEEEKKRTGALVKIYETMKPKDAANIFNTLDMDVLVEVMTQMSERKLAPVLAAMDPDRARAVTVVMADQKKLPELPAQN